MKSIILIMMLCLTGICSAELRTWTAINGNKVEAEFISNNKGQVALKMKTGKVFSVPLDKLSKEDQDFIGGKSLSRSLKDSIVGKIITLEIQGNKTQTILNINGKVLSGINYNLEDINQRYEIIGNNVRLYAGISATPIVVMSFSSSNPKPSDKIELKIIDNNTSIAGKIIDIESSEKTLRSSKYIPPEGAVRHKDRINYINELGTNVRYGEEKGMYFDKNTKEPYSGIIYELDSNGKVLYQGSLKDGMKDGLWQWWSPNGKKEAEQYWKQNKIHGKGISFHKNGQKHFETEYNEGKRHGTHLGWYEDGKKIVVSKYRDGQRDGLGIVWHENGQKHSETTYNNGELVSEKYWNSKGEQVNSYEEADAE